MIFDLSKRPFATQDYFRELEPLVDWSLLEIATTYERAARVEAHAFFDVAKRSRSALCLWVSQEAIVTNPFSQVLFRVISAIKNVHVRSLLLPVVIGEHGPVRNGVANRSHPWLIWKLCRSLGIAADAITPTRAVQRFIAVLENAADDPMRSLGILGVGNELMLLSEYRSILACFDAICPDAAYHDFLQANIDEDATHTRLIGAAASALKNLGYPESEFLEGSRTGVDARIAYYDELLMEVS